MFVNVGDLISISLFSWVGADICVGMIIDLSFNDDGRTCLTLLSVDNKIRVVYVLTAYLDSEALLRISYKLKLIERCSYGGIGQTQNS